MVFELVKNSLRAVQEHFMDSDKVAPPIRIIVTGGVEDVTIKVLIVANIYNQNCTPLRFLTPISMKLIYIILFYLSNMTLEILNCYKIDSTFCLISHTQKS